MRYLTFREFEFFTCRDEPNGMKYSPSDCNLPYLKNRPVTPTKAHCITCNCDKVSPNSILSLSPDPNQHEFRKLELNSIFLSIPNGEITVKSVDEMSTLPPLPEEPVLSRRNTLK